MRKLKRITVVDSFDYIIIKKFDTKNRIKKPTLNICVIFHSVSRGQPANVLHMQHIWVRTSTAVVNKQYMQLPMKLILPANGGQPRFSITNVSK